MSPPAVSILMPVYNAGRYLDEAIESVLSQRAAPSWELLIVDDGSSDDSAARAAAHAAREPERIRLFRHPGGANRGSSASRNLALAHAQADVVALLDADDVWLPDALAVQTRVLAAHPDVVMAYAGAERWYSHAWVGAEDVTPPVAPPAEPTGILTPPTLLTWFWNDEALAPCTCTVFARTDVVRRLGGFEAEFTGLYDDQVLYVKLALHGLVHCTPTCLARYRQHLASCCRTSSALQPEARKQFEAWVERYRRSSMRSAHETP